MNIMFMFYVEIFEGMISPSENMRFFRNLTFVLSLNTTKRRSNTAHPLVV